MDFQDSSGRTPLVLALKRGTQRGADLGNELRRLGDYKIKSKADAEAVCDVLEQLAIECQIAESKPSLHAIIALFQEVEGTECAAFPVMAERGVKILVQIVNDGLDTPPRHDPEVVLFALKILAASGAPAGTDVILRAARKPLQPDAYMWSVILRAYTSGHPERRRLFTELSKSLPTDFLAISLLDSANSARSDGIEDPHPFDSAAGVRKLEEWLADKNEEHFTYAQSATLALPHITNGKRDALLALAFEHPSVDVQLQAARAAAMLGREAGIRWLARSCLDVNLSVRAQFFLSGLGHSNAIPSECQDASFRAKAKFADWLAHPNELGRPPDELEIVDHRELAWPPERTQKKLWLIRYRMHDAMAFKENRVGVGLVGSFTFCFFFYQLDQRPPEDVYAIHCYWEMKDLGLVAEVDVGENSREFDHMLRQCTYDNIAQATIVSVAELSQELDYPQRLVAVAKATCRGEPGWLIADGPRSLWYARSQMPQGTSDKTVLMIHVGRILLNLR